MRVSEIVQAVEAVAPPRYSAEYCEKYGAYDNSGLLVGREDGDARLILLALDVTGEVVDQAIRLNAGMIVSHHPVIYKPVATITGGTRGGEILLRLIEAGIAVYSAHLGLDAALIGTAVAELLGIQDCVPLYPLSQGGIGCCGTLKQPATLGEFRRTVAEKLQDPTVFSRGEDALPVRRAAVLPGGGGDSESLERAKRAGADVYVSAEFAHHVLTEADGIGVVSASHFALERAALPVFKQRLKQLVTAEVLVANQPFPYR